MSECNCTLKHNWDPGVEPCGEISDDGLGCTKPEEHLGPHSACSVISHPVETWE